MKYSFTRISQNSKTGPIPVTMSHKGTCPNACPLKKNGCYAESGHTNIHWSNITTGKRGIEWAELLEEIRTIRKGQLWRHNVAGDLPSDDAENIDAHAMQELTQASKHAQGFTYTHYDPTIGNNAQIIAQANAQGFTVNLSANSPEHADALASLNIGPVVTLLEEHTATLTHTPAGRAIVICPAVTKPDQIQCANCGLCAKADRRSIVGFPVHGVSKKKAARVIMMATTSTKVTA